MLLCEELYFEITLTGVKSEIKKLVTFLKTGGLDDFFEFSADYISYDDEFDTTENEGKTSVVLANDDYGIEIDELDTDDFLDVFCRAAKNLEVVGSLYDADEDEYRFISDAGESYYLNSDKISKFNEDLDREEEDSDD